jgi:enterochelin esterase family protein
MKHSFSRRIALLAALVIALLSGAAIAQPPPMAVVSPDVHADRTVTFRLLAPNAKQVTLHGEFDLHSIAMTKDDAGVWSVTVGPVKPNVYGYGFTMDGLNMPDPCNTFVRVGSLAFESQVEVPGDDEAFLAVRNVPHGALHEYWYHSKELNTERRVLVYTPPGYESGAIKEYPVLYLLHGMGDDEGFWTSVGRANFIMDNLLAENKARPALIVMPFGHASRNIMGFRRPGGAAPGAGGPPQEAPGIGAIFGIEMLETDLKENIIPLVEQNYRVSQDRSQRAIAGLSMGGYQALDIGLNNPQMFAYVAGFSSALVGPDFKARVQPALSDAAKANAEYKLLWLSVGGDDGLLSVNQKFEQDLTASGIKHTWEVIPGYAHWWTLWRVNLRDLMPKLFNE